MDPATGVEWHREDRGWRKHPTAIVCAALIGVLLLELALPSPWGLGAFELHQPPVRIVSFELNLTPTPAGPRMTLTLENSGSSAIVYLSASLSPPAAWGGQVFNFPSVNGASPLAPGQSATVTVGGPLPDENLTCGAFYAWTVSGISGSLSAGSEFKVQTGAQLSCIDEVESPGP
jgi:hypothetical protein